MTEELKPCPHCGSAVSMQESYGPLTGYISCDKCPAKMQEGYIFKMPEVIEKWNKRVSDD